MEQSFRYITLIRHAEAMHGGGLSDAERPLSPSGLAQLSRIPQVFAGITPPERVLCSPAQRTRETLIGIRTECPSWPRDALYDERLYMSSWRAMVAMIGEYPDTLKHLAVIGHNMGISRLASQIAGRPVSMNTFGVVYVESAAESWKDLIHAPARIIVSWRA